MRIRSLTINIACPTCRAFSLRLDRIAAAIYDCAARATARQRLPPKPNGFVMTDIPPPATPRRTWVADAWRIAVILAFVLATRVWVVRHTEVTSRDSIG